jgi:hypothetical protein
MPKRVLTLTMLAGILLLLLCTVNSPLIVPRTFYASTTAHVSSLYSSEHRQQHFPQAIIIGVKKGGTRALINMLSSHPQVESAKGEIHFFDKNETFRRGVEWYIEQMPFSTPDQITIEKSPSYFITPHVPQRIHSLSPTVKLLLIVRHPIERTISDYVQLFNPGRIGKERSFDKVVLDGRDRVNDRAQVIKVSCYDVYIVHWLKYFPLDQIHIVDGGALISNPGPEIIKVQQFLGINDYFREEMFYFNTTKGFYCWYKVTDRGDVHSNCLGSSKGHPHLTVSASTKDLLQRYFSAHNDHFFKLVQREFPWNSE